MTLHLSEWLSSTNQQISSAGKDVTKGKPFCTIGGNADWCSHCEKQNELPQKIKNGTALWPSDSTSGNIFKESHNTNLKEYMHPYVHCSILYNDQGLEAAQVSISR